MGPDRDNDESMRALALAVQISPLQRCRNDEDDITKAAAGAFKAQ